MAGFFDVLNVRVSIAGRMRILALLMVVPVAITGFLLYKTHKANIDFARSELAGAQYLAAVWPDMMAGAAGKDATDGAALGEQAKSNAWMVDPGRAADLNGKSGAELLAAANGLMVEITDKSKLILDPDLDSYYMMDAVTTKLPAVMMAAAAVHDDPASEINTVTFDNALTALHDSFEKSGQYGKSGKLNADTEAAITAMVEAGKAFRADPSAYDAFLKSADAVFAPGDRDLAAMQKTRADAETGRMIAELALAFAILAVALGVATSIAGGLSQRLTRLSGLMETLAKGRDTGEIPFVRDGHETGVIARTLATFRTSLTEAEGARAAQTQQEAQSAAAQKQLMLSMADRFESSMLSIVENLNHSAEGLGQTAGRLCSYADQTQTRSQLVAHAMDSASGNVQSVAGATEEMSASSNSISDQAERAATAAGEAARRAHETTQKVAAMNEAAIRIGSSVEMITQITSQTNLLALNATIEAARAGEAGRGFNVVATEVKALASQTARATQEISLQVRGVQEATAQAADAMTAIADMVLSLRDISTEISESVTQQAAAVGEISRSTAEVASTTSDITGAVEEVNATAGDTGAEARTALQAVEALNDQTRMLRQTAIEFLRSVRAG